MQGAVLNAKLPQALLPKPQQIGGRDDLHLEMGCQGNPASTKPQTCNSLTAITPGNPRRAASISCKS